MTVTPIHPDIFPGMKLEPPVPEKDVLAVAAKLFRVDYIDLKSRCRKQPLPRIRFMCFNIHKKYYKNTLQGIGKIYDRDHSTIINGITQHEIQYELYKDYRDDYDLLIYWLGLEFISLLG